MKLFGDKLAEAVRRCGNPVVVGLDPRWEQLPAKLVGCSERDLVARAAAYEQFCCEVIEVVAPWVPAVKPQAAFFEECGPAGMWALYQTIKHARSRGLLVIMDGKRNDIGSTAEAYARAYLGREQSAWHCDALTISPYLGADSLEPFINVAHERGAGVFVLVKTSNPGGGMLQDKLIDGEPLYRVVANYVEEQSRMNRSVSGYGSQGGTAKDVVPAFDENGLGAVINNSRGIIFAHQRAEYKDKFGAARWQDAVAAATREMIASLRAETNVGKL